MGKKTTITCTECGQTHEIAKKEYNRKIKKGKTNFFCSLNCGADYDNRENPRFDPEQIKPKINKECPYCGTEFITKESSKERVYCSQFCSNKIITEKQKRIGRVMGLKHKNNLSDTAHTLLKREWPKYSQLSELLNSMGINHRFEVRIKNCIFDMLLKDYDLLVEFDGPDHDIGEQKQKDKQKEQIAHKCGYKVTRIPTEIKTAIEPEPVLNLVN